MPYRWYISDEPEGQRLLEAAQADGLALPVVITPDGEPLIEPTDAELAARVGLATTPSKDFYDLIVIGGGPAGLGAAVYGASEGLRTVLVERTATGGQAGQSSRIENYLGFPDGVSGAQLTDRARRQATKFGAEVLTTRDVVGLEINGSARGVRFADGTTIDAHTIILATGVSYRQLDAPGLAELTGRGVYYGSALTEAAGLPRAGRVHRRRGELGRAGRGVPGAAREVGDDPGPRAVAGKVDVVLPDQADRGHPEHLGPDLHRGHRGLGRGSPGEPDAAGQRVRRRRKQSTPQLLFLFIGAAPLTDWLDGVVVRDSAGFVVAGPDLSVDGERPRGWELDRMPYHLETSVPGVFVAGDARAESAKRVASAVGEGAMAVMLVHRYLEKR